MVIRGRWFDSLGGHRWYLAIATTACVAAAIGGAAIFLPHRTGHRPRALAADCGIVTCTATIPPSAIASPSLRPQPTPSAAAPAINFSATPSATSAPPATLRAQRPPPTTAPVRQVPAVTVSYALVQRWDGGFQGQFTIVNHGSTALAGWELRAVFPGDQIDSAWGSAYQASGDTLVLDPSFPATVPAGTSQSMNFTAGGNTTSPGGCTLNGAACR